MKKITIAAVLIFTMGIFFTSCNETKKEVKKEVEETKEDVKKETHEHSDEMALATYQCPMQCEGDKTYDKPGTCPKCKMDLKEVEKAKEVNEENHEEKMDNNNHDHEE